MIGKIIRWVRAYGVWYAVKNVWRKGYMRYVLGPCQVNRRLSVRERRRQERVSFPSQECISILVPLYNTPEKFLRPMIGSVVEQTYGNWQLCLADGSDEEHAYVGQICREYAKKDRRICYQKLEKNKGISENTNACMEMVKGSYIGLFDHDDLLHPSALYEVMCGIARTQADVLYTDEATFLGKEARLLSVYRKPDFGMENLRTKNFICHFTVIRSSLFRQVGGFRREYDGSQDHDLFLRVCEQAVQIIHIPKVLYFWRAHKESVAWSTGAKEYVVEAGVNAVRAHLQRTNLAGRVGVLPTEMLMYEVIYEHNRDWEKDVTVVYEEHLEQLREPDTAFVMILRRGVKEPDKEAAAWMIMHMAKPEVTAVTPMVLDKNGKIDSAGAVWNAGKSVYEKKYHGKDSREPGDMNELLTASATPAVVNGCMLVRSGYATREAYRAFCTGKGVGEVISEPRARLVFLAYTEGQ